MFFWSFFCFLSPALIHFRTRRHQKESLERALNRSIVYCYATEGTYPESLEDLKAHYGLTYDEDLFFVDYQTVGANIYPDVTIIEKGAGK